MVEPYYDDGNGIVIYNGDCREILPQLGTFDMLLTDPPYGIGESEKVARRARDGAARPGGAPKYFEASDWDATICEEGVELGMAMARSQIVFGGNYYLMMPSSCWLVWDKDNGSTDFADCELAWTNLKMAVRKFRWRWNGMLQEHGGDKKETRVHPTQKPLALMRWCLTLVPGAKTILDPFAGSCTTGVAAKLEGRKATLIEISERYCEIGVNRLRQGVLPFAEVPE